MTDETSKTARLIKVMDEIIKELERQSVAEVLANLGFNPRAKAEVVIRTADGDVVPFPAPGEICECSAYRFRPRALGSRKRIFDSEERSLPTVAAALPKLPRNHERAVRRVCGVLDGQILPMRRLLFDRDAICQHRPPVDCWGAQPGRPLDDFVGLRPRSYQRDARGDAQPHVVQCQSVGLWCVPTAFFLPVDLATRNECHLQCLEYTGGICVGAF